MKKINTSSQTIRECDVFISYRREGGDMTAMYFYQALKERGYNVFYDLEVLRAGKFNEALLDSIKSCTDFVVILSPNALDRCNDENDWVRREIAEALRSKKNIVPVMLKGFAFPETLPGDIDDIRYQNGLTCTTEYFEESINRLCQRYLRSVPASAGRKRPLLPMIAVLAALGIGLGAFMMMKGRTPAPAPAPAATMAITEAPTAELTATPTAELTATPTAEPTATPTAEPTATPTATPTAEPTAEPGPLVVRDTDFPVIAQTIDVHDIDETKADDEDTNIKDSPVFRHPEIRRRDIASVEFRPTLEGAPKDAWDVSEAGDGRVLAWVTPNGELFDLVIAGDGGVKIVDPPEAAGLFHGMCNARSIRFNGCVDLSDRNDFGHMFWACHELREIDFTGLCADSATSFDGLFGGCWVLEAVDISWINTARAESFREMFLDCEQLKTVDVSGFDTSRALILSGMFSGCASLESLDVSGFDTSHTTDMSRMFFNCRGLKRLDLSGFDTRRVENMAQMFEGCERLEEIDLKAFDTSRVENMAEMFRGCGRLRNIDVSGFDTGRVENMFGMFRECNELEALEVGGWDTARVEDMGCLFFGCETLDGLDLSKWKTGRVTSMNHMFNSCRAFFELDVSGFDTAHVTDLSKMFGGCEHLVELDLAGWDVSNVEDMTEMFDNCVRLESIGRDPAGFAHGNTDNMYRNCEKLSGV